MATAKKKRPVIITTERRGVFYGYLKSYDKDRRSAVLEDAQMAIRWGTTGGVFQLAATGPTESSKIGSRVPSVVLEVVECIVDATVEAEEAWSKT